MRALLAAVASGDASVGVAAFFPVQAYAQTKIYSDAAHDWATRLIPEFGVDVRALHPELDPTGTPMRLLGYAVDDATAVWVLPGEEFNRDRTGALLRDDRLRRRRARGPSRSTR